MEERVRALRQFWRSRPVGGEGLGLVEGAVGGEGGVGRG